MLGDLREHHAGHVDPSGTVIRQRPDGELHWWTWAGSAVNRTLQSSVEVVDPRQRLGDQVLRLRHGTSLSDASAAITQVEGDALVAPRADRHAVRGLTFSAALPEQVAVDTVSARLGDKANAKSVLVEQRHLRHD